MNRVFLNKKIFWLFLTPMLICFTMVVVIPFILGILYSFTNWTGTGSAVQSDLQWVGWENYKAILSETQFQYSLIYTFIYAIISVILVNVVGFTLAMFVTRGYRGQNFFRSAFFLPNMIGGIILGFIWTFILNQTFLQLFSNFGYTSPLGDPVSATIALVSIGAWVSGGYVMLIYVAALNNISTDVIEAAKIDGAGSKNLIKKIYLPLIIPAFTVTLFTTLISSFKTFDLIWSLTGGLPANEFNGVYVNGTQNLAMDIYSTAFSNNQMAKAQAEAMIFFVILAILGVMQVYFIKKREVES